MTGISFLSPTHVVKAAYDSTTAMALPFLAGATVYFNGPHNWDAPRHPTWPWNSLDLQASPANTPDPVYAPTPGKVHLTDCGRTVNDYIRVDPSGNNTGWQATFIHLSEIDVQDGATVNRGDKIGMTGNPTGGCGSGNVIHTHFSIWYVGSGTFSLGAQAQEVDWGGVNRGGADVGNQPVVGDWVWTDGSDQYLGTATNIDTGATARCNDSSGCIPTVSIYDDGDIPGAPTLGQPGGPADSWGQGRLDVFVRGNDYGYWQNTGDGTTTGWSGWVSLSHPSGILFVSQPVAVSWSVGHIDLFGIGENGALYHQKYDGGAWLTSWESLGSGPNSTLTGNPAVVSWGPNRLDVFSADTQGQVWHTCWDQTYGWHQWQSLAGGTLTDPVAVSWAPNRIDIFDFALSNGTYQYVHQVWDGAWHPGPSNWEAHGNPNGTTFASRPSMVAWAANRLDIVGTANDGVLYHQSWTGSGWSPGGLSGWEKVVGGNPSGTSFVGTPAVVTWSANRLDVFIHDATTSQVGWHTGYNWSGTSGTWSNWENHSGSFTSDLYAVSWGLNRLDVFGRGQDHGTYWQYWAGGTSWLPNTPDPPGPPKVWLSLGGQAT